LKPADERFAAFLARGLEQAEAYRRSRDTKGVSVSPQRIAERACRAGARTQVKARVTELLHEAKIADIDSVGVAYRQLLADMDAARTDKNHTALAAYSRIRVQVLGMVKDAVPPHCRGVDERRRADQGDCRW
jgi:hypothetical protein